MTSVLIGWEELLCTAMFMGADGGTLSSGGVAPEVVMKLYNEARAGKWDAAKQTQFKLLELFSLMVGAPNFPEGFPTGLRTARLQGRSRTVSACRIARKISSPKCVASWRACWRTAVLPRRRANAGAPSAL